MAKTFPNSLWLILDTNCPVSLAFFRPAQKHWILGEGYIVKINAKLLQKCLVYMHNGAASCYNITLYICHLCQSLRAPELCQDICWKYKEKKKPDLWRTFNDIIVRKSWTSSYPPLSLLPSVFSVRHTDGITWLYEGQTVRYKKIGISSRMYRP